MELKQPVESDSDVLRPYNVNKKHPSKHHGKTKIKLPQSEGEPDQKSLRHDWEKTLAKKDHHSEPGRLIHEGVFKFDGPPEREIHLHVDAEQIQEDEELDNKSDPQWEPWQAKRQETKPQPKVTTVEDRVPEVAEPMVAEAAPAPQSLDPALAAEALLHSQAVASITKEHAQTAVAPSYRSELPKEAQDIMDRLQPARDHHLEQSAWHNIEVDNKTGRAVEEPTFSYGEAFQNEQKTEANASHTDDGVASASGQLAVSSPIFNNLNDRDAALLSGAQPASTTPLATPHSQIDFNSGPSHSSGDALLWTILTVIILAIFLALFI